MNLKQVLPIEVNYRIRHFREWNGNEQPECSSEALRAEKRVFFLDAPAYANLGDQAIAYAMESFIAKILPDYVQIEVTEDKLPATLNWLKKNIRESDLICLTGGGNMGVMYQRYESVRRLVLTSFPHNPIVIFPQTFDYGDTVYAKRELGKARAIYGKVSKLILCARDEESFEKMKAEFPKVKIVFCPDIVLSLDYRWRFAKKEKVGICLRNDAESILSEDDRKNIYSKYPEYDSLSTTDTDVEIIDQHNRKQEVEKKLQEFGSKKLVITDRLHGSTFAYITGTPVIAFPNTNGKVERMCRYLTTNGNVGFTKTISEIPVLEPKAQGTVMDRFGELEDAIKYIVKS